MFLSYFTEQPMNSYPADEGLKAGYTSVLFSNKYFDPVEGSLLVQTRALDRVEVLVREQHRGVPGLQALVGRIAVHRLLGEVGKKHGVPCRSVAASVTPYERRQLRGPFHVDGVAAARHDLEPSVRQELRVVVRTLDGHHCVVLTPHQQRG